jgi:hypothetical protein
LPSQNDLVHGAVTSPRRRRPFREIPVFRKEARRILYRALPLVAAVRLALWLVPTRLLFRYASRWADRARVNPSQGRPTKYYVTWAIRVAARRVPGASCLTQALAGQILLGYYGHVSEICVGVARDGRQSLRAHAWVEVDGDVLIGNRRDLDRYARFPAMSAAVPRHALRG